MIAINSSRDFSSISGLVTSGIMLVITPFFYKSRDLLRKILEGDLYYRIMTKGRRQIEPYIQTGELSVSYIREGKPRTARKILSQILNSLNGEIRICDPYYGVRSLDAIEMIPDACKVRFLSSQTSESAAKISNAISDFKKEHANVEIRVFPNPKLIHDRYIISEDNLLILGHGIKDIGNKESFVINIQKEHARDLLSDLKQSFDEKWSSSTAI
jgi:hypothetical protein